MPLKVLASYLEKHQIGYTVIQHPDMITDRELEGVSHIPGNGLAKAVVVRVDRDYVMVVIPSTNELDLQQLRTIFGVRNVELATRKESERLFPGCETGATPPFGNLFGIPVYIDRELTIDDCITFKAGNNHELIILPYREFERLVNPGVIAIREVAGKA